MKKIILFILCFVLFLGFNVNAETIKFASSAPPLIAEEGSASLDTLLYGDYDSIMGSCDFSTAGKYIMSNHNTKTNTYLMRDVYIFSDLVEGGGIFVNDPYIGLNAIYNNLTKSDIIYQEIVPYTEGYYLIVSYTINGTYHTKVYCYKGTDLMYYVNLISGGIVADCMFLSNQLVGVINYTTEDSSSVYMFTLDEYTTKVTYHKYDGNKTDQAIGICYIKPYIYLALNTYSSQGLINRMTENEIGVVLKIMPSSFMLMSSIEIGNNYDNEILSFSYNSSGIYILMDLEGSTGTFKNPMTSNYSGKCIFFITKDLSASYIFVTQSISDDVAIYAAIDIIYLVMSRSDNTRGVTIITYDSELTENEFYNLISANYQSFACGIAENSLYIFLNADETILSLSRIEDGVLEEDLTINLIGYPVIKNIFSINNKFYLTSLEDGIIVYEFMFVQVKKEVEDCEKYSYEKCTYYLNSKEVGCISKPSYENLQFGTYENSTSLYLDDVIISTNQLMEVKACTNIEDNGIYDLNINLLFNGTATLNNDVINSGYVINIPGKYCLDIIGKGGAHKTLSFEVMDLSYDSQRIDAKTDIPKLNSYNKDTNLPTQVSSEWSGEINTYKDTMPQSIIFLGILVSGVLIFVLFIFRRKKV